MAAPNISNLDARLQGSHDRRRAFETFVYIAISGITIAVATLIVIGIAMPPPAQCAPAAACVAPADWGRAIVDKAQISIGPLFDILCVLGGMAGITLTRGHFDARAIIGAGIGAGRGGDGQNGGQS